VRRRDQDDESSQALPRPRRSGRAGAARKHSLGFLLTAGLAVTLAAALVGGTLTVYFKERSFWESIRRIAVGDLGKRPPKLNSALNVLVIGSDSRKGKNRSIGGYVPGQRSDTVMMLHISPGGRHIVVMSFPRDSAVPIYSCAGGQGFSGQQAAPGQVEQLNTSFSLGGPGCLWKTIEHTTQIRLDNFLEIHFSGFIHIINALGGVAVCVPYPISGLQYDPGLHLAAGMHRIWGRDALAFWRAREGIGLGSDLQRIRRDQLLMISLVHGLLRSGVLKSLSRTISVVNAAASAMTTDSGLTQAKMLHLAESLRGIAAHQVQFIEVPVVGYPPNLNWVEWAPQDAQLFSAIRHDVKLPKLHSRTGKHAKRRGGPAVRLLSPAQVRLQVLNGSGVSGVASSAATALTSRGFTVTKTGDAPSFTFTGSVVEYGSAADLAAARTVAAQLSHATVRLAPRGMAGTVRLILGSTYTSLKQAHGKLGSTVGSLSGQYGGLTGSANVCKASKPAFSG
jgi:LCP family protein required for cell wall assembly